MNDDLGDDTARPEPSADPYRAESAGLGGVPIEPPDSAIARLEAEVAELRDRHLRLAAEYDNYRKRTARERSELTDRAQADLLVRLLDVVDDMDRLAAGGAQVQTVDQLHEAVVLTEKKLWKELEAAGFEAVEPTGAPFDPEQHEAISSIPAPDAARAHLVAQTFQVGYRLKGLLLRPARVQVYGEPALD
ncbi:MAG TPA: nucleotide exchange factor GrpE [Gemmatimonadales bacterium]|nr:nucleotide exchange factor GrpE [Gemmatimonadales bacterium]